MLFNGWWHTVGKLQVDHEKSAYLITFIRCNDVQNDCGSFQWSTAWICPDLEQDGKSGLNPCFDTPRPRTESQVVDWNLHVYKGLHICEFSHYAEFINRMDHNELSHCTIGKAINVLIVVPILNYHTSNFVILTLFQFMYHTILVYSTDMTFFFQEEYHITYINVCIIFEPFWVVHECWYVWEQPSLIP